MNNSLGFLNGLLTYALSGTIKGRTGKKPKSRITWNSGSKLIQSKTKYLKVKTRKKMATQSRKRNRHRLDKEDF